MTENLLIADIPAPEDHENKPIKTDEVSPPEGVPIKFWNKEKQEIRVDALLASYLALEKKLSTMIAAPTCPEDKVRLLKLIGLPDSPEQYDVTVKADFLDIDPELNTRLHAKGFTTEQVQEVYDLAVEKFVPLILEMAAEFQADREVERLSEEFGGTERWQEIASQLNEYGRKNLPPSAFEGLCCSYDGVMALYRMMKNDKTAIGSRNEATLPDVMDESHIRSLMQNPKYWRDRDPSFIAKVSEGFQKLYGEKA